MWSAAEEAGRQGGNSHFEPGGACALGPPDYRDALELHVAGERDVDDDLRVVLLARAALCVFQRRSFVSIEGLSADQRTVPAARIGCEYWSVGRHTLVRSSRSSQLRKRSLQDPGTSSFRARTCEHNDRQTSVIEPYAGVRNESKRRRVLLLVEMLPACAGIPSVLSLSSLSLFPRVVPCPCQCTGGGTTSRRSSRRRSHGRARSTRREAPFHMMSRAPPAPARLAPHRSKTACAPPRRDGLTFTPKKHIHHVHLLFEEENVRI